MTYDLKTIRAMPDEELARIKAGILARWDEKPRDTCRTPYLIVLKSK